MTSVLDRMLQTRYVPDKEKFAAHREYMMQRAKQKALAKKDAEAQQSTEQTLEQKMGSLKETVNTLLYGQNTQTAEDIEEDTPDDAIYEEAYAEEVPSYEADADDIHEDCAEAFLHDECTEQEQDEIEEAPQAHETALAAQSDEETAGFENNIQFGVRLRGYDREEVDNYIAALTQDYNALCEELDTINNENALLCKGFLALMQKLPAAQAST